MRVFKENILMGLSKGIEGTLVQAGDNLAVKFFSMVLAGADLGGGCRGCAPPPPAVF